MSLLVEPGPWASPKDAIKEFIIRNLNPSVVADFRFVSACVMTNELHTREVYSYEISYQTQILKILFILCWPNTDNETS